MARKRKGEEDEEKPAAGAATATDDEDEEEEADTGDTGDGSDDSGDESGAVSGGRQAVTTDDEKDAFDAADEADSIADLSEKEQDERLLDLQRRGFDVSVVRARLNHKKRKQHAQTAELERLQPVKFPDGTQAAGTLDRFEAPFSELGVKDVARKVYGGGTYAILYYDGNHVIKHREVFTVPGKPKSTDEVDELKKTTPPPSAPPDQTGGYSYRPPEIDTEKEALREQIRNHELRTMLAEQDRRHQEQMRVLMDAVKGANDKKSSSLPDIIAAAAPFVPVFAAYVSARGKDKQDVGELMKAFRDQNNDTLRQMKDAIDTATKGQRNDPMAAATTKLVDLAIAKTLGNDGRDPNAIMFDIMKRMLPQMMEQMMEVASIRAQGGDGDGGGDDGKISPRYVMDKITDALKPFMEQMQRGNRGGPPMGPSSAGMPMMPYPYPNPYGPPPVQPTPGVYPYGSAPQPPQVPQAHGVAPQIAPPGVPVATAPAAAHGPASAQPSQPGVPTNGAPQPAAAAQPAGPAEEPDIHPQVFVLMYQFLQSGKTGGDLADVIDKDLEEIASGKKPGPRMLSDKAIDTLEDMKPEMLVDEVLKAAPQQLLAPFLVAPPPAPPGTPQLPPQIAPHVRGFVLEFCQWWHETAKEG